MHPLLENYEKYYGKKEKPKIPRIEDYEGEKTIADELADVLEFVLEEFAYKPALYGNAVVDVADIASLIDTLRDTVTIEELSQDDSETALDAL
jgi:hypothetical protein